ncbi:MAG: glycosyltransferase family 1 protein, partial [Thermoprotei archaeon]
ILYVGRLVRRKGVHILIEAFKILQRRGLEVKLVIGGKGYMEPFLRFMASDTDNIVFLGAVSEGTKPALFSEAKVFALPSLAGESFGVVLLEALSSGTPVVATRVGGIPEIIADGKDGLLVEPGDPEELAEAVAFLLKSPSLWSKMSLNARRKAVEKYSIDKVGRLYEETYFEALELARKVKILVK